jgi:glycosyltransferase involved in cell wall biosynthesis
MIIGIDARFALHKLRGVGNYSASLIKYLLEADKTNRYILYTDRKDSEGIFPRQSNLCVKNIGFGGYFIWEQILLPLAVKKDKVDILHCLANTAPLFLPFGIKLVSTLHDVSYLKPYFIMPRSPYLYQRLGRIYRKIIVPRSLRKASAVITVSEFAKQDILTQIPYLDKNKVFITYEATDDNFKIIDKDRAKLFVRCKYGIKGKYIINVGGRDPQKNTSFLIESFLELKKQNVLQEQIVIIGFKNSRKASIYKKLINTEI